ncbi:Tim44-like domain protein [Candidatus Trichorickettsia mobilis]|uniref:Tim44-like domain protein n=1 Tax=Candidatus Trichorickettsia mobilis TaxID=1346319 RepID=A0ABZ0URQ5_9RICK|nr:TIM44-like domain-containing protein [Candidatus Trichorickettsia mobilis]WPY00501.1 Tim44-like domain protein [Candidatus Trichorickettsia mobilis]
MSVQLLELLFFAGIAFLIINKLISTLGTTSDDDPAKRNSYFGENASLKDVTNTTVNSTNSAGIIKPNFLKKKVPDTIVNLPELIIMDNEQAIIQGLTELRDRMPSFNPGNFLRNAKSAFKMIIEAGVNNNTTMLEELVDKRYLSLFSDIVSSYGKIQETTNLEAKISEIYMFGNNVFIKVIFNGTEVTNNIANLYEEWTFSKSLIAMNNNWYLNNIERLQ